MLTAAYAELAATRAAFCHLIAHWRLTQAEVRHLLAQGGGRAWEGRVLPDELDVDSERRVRLLLRLDAAISRLAPGIDVGFRLRRCPEGADVTFLSSLGDLPTLRAAVSVAEDRCNLGADRFIGAD